MPTKNTLRRLLVDRMDDREVRRIARALNARGLFTNDTLQSLPPSGRPLTDLVEDLLDKLEDRLLLQEPALSQLIDVIVAERPDLASELAKLTGVFGEISGSVLRVLRPDPFFGRERQLKRIRDALRSGMRLITLHGPHGIGKTCLARHAAWALDGDLGWSYAAEASLTSAKCHADVVRAFARALDLDSTRSSSEAALAEQIRQRLLRLGRTLIVVDDCQAVAEPLRAQLVEWLAAAPQLHVIVASQAVLNLPMEVCVSVGPLAVEDAISMFQFRLAQATFAETLPDREEVRALVEALQGLPKAIELAAMGGRTYSIADMAQLYATIALKPMDGMLQTGWDLLNDEQRAAAVCLSYFPERFTFLAAQQVLAASSLNTQLTHELEQRGWLISEHIHGLSAPLLWMLEVTKRFAQSRAGTKTAPARMQARCVVATLTIAERAAAEVRGGSWRTAILLLEGLYEAMSAIIELVPPGSASALRAALVMDTYLNVRGPLYEQPRLLNEVLRVRGAAPVALLVNLLIRRSGAHRKLSRYDEAEADVREALRIVGPAPSALRARTLRDLAGVLRLRLHLVEAGELLDQAEAMLSSPADLHDLAIVRAERGLQLSSGGDLEGAVAAFHLALQTFERRGDVLGIAATRRNLSDVLTLSGQTDEVPALLESAAQIWRDLGSHFNEAECRMSLGYLHLNLGRTEQAMVEFDAAATIFSEQANAQRLRSVSSWRALALLESGVPQEAIARLRALCREADRERDVVQSAHLRTNLALALLVAGEPHSALAPLAEVEALGTRASRQNLQSYRACYQALAMLPGRLDAAHAALHAARIARSEGDPGLGHLIDAVHGCLDGVEARRAPPERRADQILRVQRRYAALTAGDHAPARRFQDVRLVSELLRRQIEGLQGGAQA